MNKGVLIHLVDRRTEKETEFHYEGGIIEYVHHINEGQEALHPDVIHVEGDYYSKENDVTIHAEIAMQWTQSTESRSIASPTTSPTKMAGPIWLGCALTRSVNKYISANSLAPKGGLDLSGEDVREGLTR